MEQLSNISKIKKMSVSHFLDFTNVWNVCLLTHLLAHIASMFQPTIEFNRAVYIRNTLVYLCWLGWLVAHSRLSACMRTWAISLHGTYQLYHMPLWFVWYVQLRPWGSVALRLGCTYQANHSGPRYNYYIYIHKITGSTETSLMANRPVLRNATFNYSSAAPKPL